MILAFSMYIVIQCDFVGVSSIFKPFIDDFVTKTYKGDLLPV